jgi:hypothetical protein
MPNRAPCSRIARVANRRGTPSPPLPCHLPSATRTSAVEMRTKRVLGGRHNVAHPFSSAKRLPLALRRGCCRAVGFGGSTRACGSALMSSSPLRCGSTRRGWRCHRGRSGRISCGRDPRSDRSACTQAAVLASRVGEGLDVPGHPPSLVPRQTGLCRCPWARGHDGREDLHRSRHPASRARPRCVRRLRSPSRLDDTGGARGNEPRAWPAPYPSGPVGMADRRVAYAHRVRPRRRRTLSCLVPSPRYAYMTCRRRYCVRNSYFGVVAGTERSRAAGGVDGAAGVTACAACQR